MAAAKTRGPGGRPTRLSGPVVTALVRQIAAGAGLDAAARSLGLGPRTVRRWRARAYSGRPEDRDFVELERRIVRAALAAASADEPSPTDWQAAAEALEHEHAHWRLPELDDVLGELGELE